jgi:hypothetical protein
MIYSAIKTNNKLKTDDNTPQLTPLKTNKAIAQELGYLKV